MQYFLVKRGRFCPPVLRSFGDAVFRNLATIGGIGKNGRTLWG